MLFKIELRTDDPELVKILCEVRKRAKFVKKALRHFIATKQGKETLRIMSGHQSEERGIKHDRSVSSIPDSTEKGAYDFDRFL